MPNLVLKYFSTPTCNVCKVLRPKVEDLVEKSNGWNFQYVDTTQSPEIAGQNLIFAVPTILLIVQGKEVKRFSRNVSLYELEQTLNKYSSILG
ncbi:MAG: thioredoxin family protein [Candidatus Marinimicrobia bacterium]|nr:thioredoxin family protein [Candidatus Neomarinimicrobiota bacterium]